MSTHNPLNEFNSYSYHHFIVVAATSAHAATISDDPEAFFQFVRDGGETPGLAVLVNPMSSNKLIVQDISWTNIMNADSGSRMQSDSINALTEGKMTLLEPLGVRFFNQLYDIYGKLGASGGGMSAIWVIKTIFVGYRNAPEDGKPEYISNLKPMLVYPTEFLSEFSEAGGRYDIKFVDSNSGAGAARISNGTAISSPVNLGGESATTETVTLQSAMQNLQDAIEKEYLKNFKKVAADRAKSPSSTMREAIPTQMQYRIKLHRMLQDSSFVMEVPRQLSVGGNGKVPWLAPRRGERLDQTIERVLQMCPQVMNLATKGDAAGVKWLPLINSSTETLDPAQNDGISSRVTFTVTTREIRTVFKPTANAETTAEVKTPQGTTTTVVENADTANVSADSTQLKADAMDASSYLEYDYTYTGKNVDVLTYDMRMNFATGFFQELITPSGVVSTGQVPATNNLTTGSNQSSFGKDGGAAVVNPGVSNSPESLHSSSPQATSTYQDIYKKWVQTETVSVSMKIRGNPLLTDGLILTPADLENSLTGTNSPSGLASNWMTGPIIVKVNVRMPVEDDPNAYEPFWYDGFYRILSVKTTFSSGDYTQELQLLGISDNTYDPVPDSTEQRPRGRMPTAEDAAAFALSAEPTGDRLPIQQLSISENGVNMIKTFESFAAKKYMDNTKYAIGYGHNLTEQESATGIINLASGPVIINNGITKEQADELLRRDIVKISEKPIHRKVAVNLYQNEYDVLCSMVYNLGDGDILGSDSTLLKLLNQSQYTQIPAEIVRWDKWNQGGKMVPNSGLVQRRKLEAQHWGSAS